MRTFANIAAILPLAIAFTWPAWAGHRVCPGPTVVYGMDVSKWQGNIDWSKAAYAKSFVIIRVSDGLYYDTKFDSNWQELTKRDIIRGVYQFFRPGKDPIAQANIVINKMGPMKPGMLPPTLDVEATDGKSPATIEANIKKWVARIKAVLGVNPMIYTGNWFWDPKVGSSAQSNLPLWQSYYCSNCCPIIPNPWPDYVIWQYSSSGTVAGITSKVDLNKWKGNMASLIDFANGGAPPQKSPKITISVVNHPPSGQASDFRPEGSSKDIMDAYEGQDFTVDVIVSNHDGTANTQYVYIGAWFESPFVIPLDYTIYTDWPHKDKKSWTINDSNSATDNPSHSKPPATGKYDLYAMSAGETKKITFHVRAAQYSIGQADHPDVRAWVWHVGNYYEEQTSWNDPVETNLAGTILRSYCQQDIYALDRWFFDAPDAPETEGWAAGNAVSNVQLDTAGHTLTVRMAGTDPYIVGPKAVIPAATDKALSMVVRTYNGPKHSRVYFKTRTDPTFTEDKAESFVAPGDGQFHKIEVSFAGNPAWRGTITGLRLDPAPSGIDVYDIGEIRAITSGNTSGDADGDGYLASPAGTDCNDHNASVHPGTIERCNNIDDNCDGNVDGITRSCTTDCGGGVQTCTNGQWGQCNATNPLTCMNYKTCQKEPMCVSKCPKAPAEICNGIDDNCNGVTDDGFDVGSPCIGGIGACTAHGVKICTPDGTTTVCSVTSKMPRPELCNGIDDNCNGITDETFYDLGFPCLIGVGACRADGKMVCKPDGSGTICDAIPRVPSIEQCNGIDDNCNGKTDEDFPVGRPCTVGRGECQRQGEYRCRANGSGVICDASAGAPAEEVCDGIDNNCNGLTDENDVCVACTPGTVRACTTFSGDTGMRICGPGALWGPCMTAIAESDATDHDSDTAVQDVDAEGEAVDNSDEDIYNPPDAWEMPPADDGAAQDKDMSLEIDDIPTVQAPTGGCTTTGSHAGAGIWILFGLLFAWTILERRHGN